MSAVIDRRLFLAGCALSFISGTRAWALPDLSGDPDALPLAVFDVPYIQSIAIDDRSGHLYLHWSDPGTERANISRYQVTGAGGVQFLDEMTPSPLIGHQGLALHHDNDGLWLFAPSRTDPRSVVKFRYKPGSAPSELASYIVFDSRYRKNATVTAAISYDQKWLIVSGRIGVGSELTNMVRVFDLAPILTSETADWSSKPTYEWSHPFFSKTPVQGIACLQDKVYIVMGGSDGTAPKLMLQHRIDGAPVSPPTAITAARQYWLHSGVKGAFEPEGICFAAINGEHEPKLYIGFNMGTKRQRIRAVFPYN